MYNQTGQDVIDTTPAFIMPVIQMEFCTKEIGFAHLELI